MRSFLLFLSLIIPSTPSAHSLSAPPPSAPPPPPITAREVAAELARLGPRHPGTAAHAAALALLRDAMRRAGLSGIAEVPGSGAVPVTSLTGVLPGTSAAEIVLSAHYDTVSRSPGAGDDGSGCGTVLAAAADLARTPRQHTLRVFLADGEEEGDLGSRAWLAALGPAGRDRILAAVNVEMVGWPGSAGPVLHSFPTRLRSGWALSPAWLVHSLLASGEAVGFPPSFVEVRASLPAQLVLRSTRSHFGADSDAFVAAGVPAATLSDSSPLHLDPAYHRPADTPDRLDPARLERWTTATAAAVRRLDRLAGRPLSDDEYLVAGGRVWLRRDLYWAGFLLWALLVLHFRPRRRDLAAETPEARLARQRAGLPGFAFRMLFLGAVFVAPVFSLLLYPAALLAHLPPRRPAQRLLWIALGVAPALLLLGAILYAHARRLVGGWALPGFATLLLAGAFAAWVVLSLRGPVEGDEEGQR